MILFCMWYNAVIGILCESLCFYVATSIKLTSIFCLNSKVYISFSIAVKGIRFTSSLIFLAISKQCAQRSSNRIVLRGTKNNLKDPVDMYVYTLDKAVQHPEGERMYPENIIIKYNKHYFYSTLLLYSVFHACVRYLWNLYVYHHYLNRALHIAIYSSNYRTVILYMG